ncbi:MAG TPA: DUF418 domain-containing protein [Sphingomonas sp.]|nr:DUF418 domain-containing protein [Sphingomonas sp.]
MERTAEAAEASQPRLPVLDILRGIAILGILFMNINDMGQSILASSVDIRHLGWTAADRAAWWVRELFASGTARALLEMLFGAGMVILTERAAAAAGSWAEEGELMRGYVRRNLILAGFGVVHVFVLLWPGDILHSYGIAAIVAFLFRRLEPRWLLAIGLFAALAQLATALPSSSPRAGASVAALRDVAEEIVREDAARTGSALDWAGAAWHYFARFQTSGAEIGVIWEAASVMLIGAALFKLGILQGQRPRRFYLVAMLAGYAIGLTLRAIGAVEITRFDGAWQSRWATYETARLAMTLGHVALINLIVTTAIGARLLHPFAAAGRAALTIYILQSVICLWVIFPPFGFALYGELGWARLMLLALAIDAALLLAATVYLRHLAIAPVEWAWRSLVLRRRLPWYQTG